MASKRHIYIFLSILTVIYIISLSRHYKKYPETPLEQLDQKQKRILFWNKFFGDDTFMFGLGSDVFQEKGCKVTNCFITTNRENYEEFDVILFHGAEINYGDLPTRRKSNQIYAFLCLESPANRQVKPILNNFFNMTITYRLDSDIIYPYFKFLDEKNSTISPSDDPHWMDPVKLDDNSVSTKTKPVAWFASNCRSRNKREQRVKELQNFIQVDVYGSCGKFTCSRKNEAACFDILRKDYFFYLSYENSNCKDYITEKVTNALLNNAIPVIYNGVETAKFLPPNSYIDASKFSAEGLAQTLNAIISDPVVYNDYFWWKKYYRAEGKLVPPFCELCDLLNSETWTEKSYNIFEWWHGNSENKICT